MTTDLTGTDLTITVIERLDDPALLADLEALLEDAVASGASVGYHAPLSPALNRDFWADVSEQIEGGAHRLLVARAPDGTVLGSVKLALCTRPNGVYRAEVQKLLVLTRHRGRGIARRLMAEVEELARGLGRSLLVLDTLKGNFGEPFYERTGWIRAGEIPGYTVEADGSRHATVLFYKNI